LYTPINADARQELEDEMFGKRVLFTSHEDWPVVDVVAASRSQHHVEADFRQMKDRLVVLVNPMHHWTDQKIRVHVFYCVLAVTIARLMQREASHQAIHLSVRELLDTAAGIQETVLIYPSTGGRPAARRMLTEQNQQQSALYDLFNFNRDAPNTDLGTTHDPH